ncbi:MAG: amidohydrolase [Clostridiales Family XIII bacterium]|jgi:predicted amidohydrolase YtcJ|nr:amidohydrolase [Clostridiales Family XIII bacterium]
MKSRKRLAAALTAFAMAFVMAFGVIQPPAAAYGGIGEGYGAGTAAFVDGPSAFVNDPGPTASGYHSAAKDEDGAKDKDGSAKGKDAKGKDSTKDAGGKGNDSGTLYVNGNIYTADKRFSKASVMAVSGSKLAYVGHDRAKAEKAAGKGAKVIDLKGRTVIPGIVEGHMHFVREGEKFVMLDVFMLPKAQILDMVRREAEKLKPGEWITGRGWNQEAWDVAQWPTKEDLDAVAPDNPVVLTRSCNHADWVNSLALKAAGITAETPNPQGGEILKAPGGDILGILTDTAMLLVKDQIPPISDERKSNGMLQAQDELFSYGITSLMDAGVTLENLALTKKLYESGKLKVRISEFIFATSGDDRRYIDSGEKPVSGLFGDRLSIRGIKIVSDGSLGARSALLLEDYSDQPGHKGNGRYTDEELYTIAKRGHDAGFQLALHGIGDGAVRQVLDVYERVLEDSPKKDHRHRVEHFQIAKPEDIPRAISMGVIPAMQSTHATSDMNMAEDRIGPERIKSAYAWRTVIDEGGIIANGSDAPVELVNPYHGIYAAVTRRDRSGEPASGWYPEQKMSRREALRSFTIWSAYALFDEEIKGSLEAGKLADFAVLDRDIMKCYPSDLKDAKVAMTVLGGEVVYNKGIK